LKGGDSQGKLPEGRRPDIDVDLGRKVMGQDEEEKEKQERRQKKN
jgi:hypothetical protein